ncbi:YjjG family noncanonical pyrimidine nucleotidase [Sporolactobacillus terrae]|uniref:Noncanonical pyrimidine nucleotidase, YjjG family n=1 Tax=Sporolactobacillus terrae TaxID=269673 RepID=A0A410D8X3_9BACL|nr:YjjG family noncanonical pyrimidine nucleotidase [Sporolactobacillus terrae]QAA22535.1 noncanonical pyrimidine nucleotidase, YjjG family [Sporolactobacillus terrae]QAA25509.1 noncanonical pyrimidine nucleotidase, YjjG family [Sporolactobacillus terrae]UAK17319.1 YjjG family noncanonical pyrimidine nucleotidase [Sporolactobacillus terrae]BBN98850.1 noncanonical pyrimidine nucleotidase, YjjG family protein [Sporolactobacillus terrae]
MHPYKFLLFDVDDTLLDFGETEKLALRLLFKKQNIQLTSEIENYYRKMNKKMWRNFEKGDITRDELLFTRFSKLFKAFGKTVDGIAMEKNYRHFLGEAHPLVPGARRALEKLKRHFDLYVVTNGVADTQRKRLADAALTPFFRAIFVSEDTGYHKPDQRFFEYVARHIPNFTSEHALIIGDSPISDMYGGNRAGMDTCWFNPNHLNNPLDLKPTYEIDDLKQLSTIVLKSE